MSRIILGLDPSEIDRWRILVATKDVSNTQPQSGTLITDRGFDLAETLLLSPSGSGWAAFAVLLLAVAYREYTRLQLVKKFDKIDTVKIATSIGAAWQRTMSVFENIEKMQGKSDRNQKLLWGETKAVRGTLDRIKSDVTDVKEISIETGNELSGQLHSLEEIVDRLEQKIDDIGDDIDEIIAPRRR
jgi:hypothetical protein